MKIDYPAPVERWTPRDQIYLYQAPRVTSMGNGQVHSADLGHDRTRSRQVSLGIDLRHVGLGVAEDDLSSLEAEPPADRGRRRVPQLVEVSPRYARLGAGDLDRPAVAGHRVASAWFLLRSGLRPVHLRELDPGLATAPIRLPTSQGRLRRAEEIGPGWASTQGRRISCPQGPISTSRALPWCSALCLAGCASRSPPLVYLAAPHDDDLAGPHPGQPLQPTITQT